MIAHVDTIIAAALAAHGGPHGLAPIDTPASTGPAANGEPRPPCSPLQSLPMLPMRQARRAA